MRVPSTEFRRKNPADPPANQLRLGSSLWSCITIPIYTGEQVASSVKDPLVHGLKGLDSSHIHELTHQSIDGVSDVFDPTWHHQNRGECYQTQSNVLGAVLFGSCAAYINGLLCSVVQNRTELLV